MTAPAGSSGQAAVAARAAAFAADRPVAGLALMLGFCMLVPLSEAYAKQAAMASVPIVVITFARFLGQSVMMAPFVMHRASTWRMSPGLWGLIVLRSLLHALSTALIFLAFRYMPLAEAVAIGYLMPFVVLLLGWAVMGEAVGPRRLAACTVGFIGTLLIFQPSFAEVGWPALLPLSVAVIFAVFQLLTRALSRRVGPVQMQAVGGTTVTLMLLPAVLLFPGTQAALEPSALWALAGVGVFGALGHLAFTWALKFAPASTVAPLQYIEIPFAVLFGWWFFGDLPGALATFGIAVTIGAGVYVMLRERAIARQRATHG
jgi:drug/metabolite transporter (DMT)-like permease